MAAAVMQEGQRFYAAVFGLVLGVPSLFMVGAQDRIVGVQVDRARRSIMLSMGDGETVAVPREVIARVAAEIRTTHEGTRDGVTRTSVRHVVVFHKHDGGFLEVASFPEPADGAEVEALKDAIEAMEVRALDADLCDPLEAVRGIQYIALSDGGAQGLGGYRSKGTDVVELSWSALMPWERALAFAVIAISMGLAAVAMAPGGMIMLVFGGAMVALMAWGYLRSIGRRVVVRIDDEALSVEERWLGRTASSRRWPLEDIAAIDYTVSRQNAGSLAVRLTEQVSARKLAQRSSTSGGSLLTQALTFGRAIQAQQLPTGRLRLGDCLRLDLALSAELARRKRVAAGSL